MVKTISKEEIAKLPKAEFKGEIIVIQTKEDAEKAVNYLSSNSIVGFDTETRPSFQKGKSHKISLIQIATENNCFLFRVNFIGIPLCLESFLNNSIIKKIGLSLKDDFAAIRKRSAIGLEGFIDIQSFVKNFGITDLGLQRIYAILFGEKISKNQRLSNWEAETLSEAQQKYAALDAWACLRIYNKLASLNSDFFINQK